MRTETDPCVLRAISNATCGKAVPMLWSPFSMFQCALDLTQGNIEDAARDGPCAHGNAVCRSSLRRVSLRSKRKHEQQSLGTPDNLGPGKSCIN